MSNKEFIKSLVYHPPQSTPKITENYIECTYILQAYVHLCEGRIEENKFLNFTKSVGDKVGSSVKDAVGFAAGKLVSNFLKSIDSELYKIVEPLSSSSDAIWKNLQKIQKPKEAQQQPPSALQESRPGYIKGTDGKFYSTLGKLPQGVTPINRKYHAAPAPITPPAQEKPKATFDVSDDEWAEIEKEQRKHHSAKPTSHPSDSDTTEFDLNGEETRPLIFFSETAKKEYTARLASLNNADPAKVDSLYKKVTDKMGSWPGLKYVPDKFRVPFALMCVTLLVVGISRLAMHGDITDLHTLAQHVDMPLDIITPDALSDITPDVVTPDIASAIDPSMASAVDTTSLQDKAINSVKSPQDADLSRYKSILNNLVNMGNHKGLQSVLDKIDNSQFNNPDVINYLKASVK